MGIKCQIDNSNKDSLYDCVICRLILVYSAGPYYSNLYVLWKYESGFNELDHVYLLCENCYCQPLKNLSRVDTHRIQEWANIIRTNRRLTVLATKFYQVPPGSLVT